MMQLNEAKEYCKAFTGISIHGNRIRIAFNYNGMRCLETLPGAKVTKTNIKFASNKRSTILQEITIGRFDYGSHFPNSPKLKLFGSNIAPPFKYLFKRYLEIQKSKVRSKHYKNLVGYGKNYLLPKFGDTPIDKIKQSDVEQWRSLDLSDLSNKSINEITSPLRAVFKSAQADQLITHNPLDYIKNLPKLKTNQADPFTMEEISLMAKGQTNRESERNAAIFACFTGMRISEWLSIAWEDVDWIKRTVSVQRSLSDGTLASTKTTGSKREVELLDQAYNILLEQRRHTEMLPPISVEILQPDNRSKKREKLRFIFLNSVSKNLWFDGKNYNDNFFTGFLRLNKIRHRTPNQCRHTFASQALIRQVPERWIMKQLGWTSIQMFEQHYAKWIDSEMLGMARKVSKLFQSDPIEIQKNKRAV